MVACDVGITAAPRKYKDCKTKIFSPMSKQFTRQEVATHSTHKDAWIIIDAVVYDITKFASLHPGGELLLLDYAGKDVTSKRNINSQRNFMDSIAKKS